MKKTFIAIALLLCSSALSAQGRYGDVRLFEFEIGNGLNVGIAGNNWYEDGRQGSRGGGNLYVEPRFNIPRSPISVGMQFSYGLSGDLYMRIGDFEPNYDGDEVRYHDLQATQSVVTFVDYNWRNWRYVSMFAGLGLGVATIDNEILESGSRYCFYSYRDRTPVLNPRFGVEFWNRLRLTAEYKFMKEDYSYFGMTVGVSIGGNRRGRGR